MEYKELNNGLKMPMIGLGVYNISERETQRVVENAISIGYRSIDTNPVLMRIGEKYGKTSAQVALKFLIQNGTIIIPKTTHRERMIENINLFDFTLSDDDLQEIRLLDTGRNVTGWPSDALKYNPESV